jgi:hypothetical protein
VTGLAWRAAAPEASLQTIDRVVLSRLSRRSLDRYVASAVIPSPLLSLSVFAVKQGAELVTNGVRVVGAEQHLEAGTNEHDTHLGRDGWRIAPRQIQPIDGTAEATTQIISGGKDCEHGVGVRAIDEPI